MKLIAEFMEKTMEVTLSKRATSELGKCTEPVCLEMELYFSCLVKKRLYKTTLSKDNVLSISINGSLILTFNPIMSDVCVVTREGEEPPVHVSTYPVTNPERFLPNWVTIDYKGNKWSGDFGYSLG